MNFVENKKVGSKIIEVQNIINDLKDCNNVLVSNEIIKNKLKPFKNQYDNFEKEFKPQARRLTFIHKNECDLCLDSMKKDDSGNYIVKENYTLSILPQYGFLYCNKCKELNNQYRAYLNYIKTDKAMSVWILFDILKLEDIKKDFKVRRSNGDIENKWHLDKYRLVAFRNDEWIIPVIKYIKNDSIFKHFSLNKFCDLNEFDKEKVNLELNSLLTLSLEEYLKKFVSMS